MLQLKTGRVTQAAALAAQRAASSPRCEQLVVLAAFTPPASRATDVAELSVLAARTAGGGSTPMISQAALMVAYRTGVPQTSRHRPWTYTLDGHTFWVLDLGQEGTFLYDTVTKQWCNFNTTGFEPQWNFQYGSVWNDQIVGCDILTDQVRVLDPNAVEDDGFRDIAHVVTGGIYTRTRKAVGCAIARVAASVGDVLSPNGAALSLRYSDDLGHTWSKPHTIQLAPGNYTQELAFRALGSFSAPGRVFEISDVGGTVRIDGMDVGLSDFDDDAPTQANA